MSPTNPRKRAAPGSPTVQATQIPQTYAASTNPQMSNPDYLHYNQAAPENAVYQDPSAYNMNNYGVHGVNGVPQAQYDHSPAAQSNQLQNTQLARRSISRQLVSTGQRPPYDSPVDTWPQFGDDPHDPHSENGGMEENDNIELLEERAAVAKRDAQSKRKQIPPFVQKLSSFLDGAKNTELIRWSDRGDSFVVLDEDEFAKTLIPELFKHNNYASFVRQLNMYGFHKRVGLSDNSMKASERKNKSPSEYYNPYFKRGHPNLLWLINKPKGGTSKNPVGKGPKQRSKPDDDGDSDDDGRDAVEEIYREHMPGASRALSQAPEPGPLQKREIAVVQHQIAGLQKQQQQITGTLNQIRKDHAQLFQQSVNFQQLHDRHENSINAILTFLATVYNRSLDGSNPPNFAQMFANGIPHEQHNQGNVVEIAEPVNPQQGPVNHSPHRRQQRLLMAPPSIGGRAQTMSPAASTPRASMQSPNSGAVEELFETSPPDSTQIKLDPEQQKPDIMMNIINNTNARAGPNVGGMEFPDVLSHYENSNGQSPLTSEQRNSVLNIIANNSSAPGSNNALVNPTPPGPPSMDRIYSTQADIDQLLQAHSANGAQINELRNIIQPPLSPSITIPGMDDGGFYNGLDTNDAGNGNLDIDQYLDTGAFFNGSSPMGGTNYNYEDYDPNAGMGDSHFDLGMDGANDGGKIETANSSEAATPDDGIDDLMSNVMRSPSKKRRRK